MHLYVSSPSSAREALTVDTDVETDCYLYPTDKPRRCVRIIEEANKYYASTETVVDDNLWYTAEDFFVFRRQAQLLAIALQASEDPLAWSNSLMRVYFALRLARTVDDVKQAIDETDVTLDERTLGLHDGYLTPISNDFLVRRRHLLEQVFRLQRLRFPTEHHRAKAIYDTSRLNSNAPRLYANFVAQAISR